MTDGSQEGDESSVWDRLRRRKVVQWGIAYAAGAWGLLQGLAYVTDTFHWPEYIQQSGTLLLLVGLPIVLVIAWYHGDRGQQRVSLTEFLVISLLFLVGGGLFWRYHGTSEAPLADAQVPAAPATTERDLADTGPSIAVLPFDNRSKLEDDAFFVDGIHDDILTQLSKVSALKVISRTSVQRFRDTRLPLKAVAQQLGVRSILEGGVQRAGDRVRISVQLIDATTDAHLWAESYDRELTVANMFAIQSEVAAAIAGTLKTALTPAEQARVKAVPTQDLEAWEAYQLGRQGMGKRTTADLADAERLFRKAIDLDPQFALGYVGLADTQALQYEYNDVPMSSALEQAEQALARALELDPGLAEAWASSAFIATYRGQLDRAEPMFRRAIEINPNHATARQWYGIMLRNVGRVDDAVAQLQRAVKLDPLSAVIRQSLGDRLADQGRFDDASAAYRKAITIDPSGPGPYLALAMLNAYAFDRFTDAVALAEKGMELDQGSNRHAGWLAGLYRDFDLEGKYFETVAQAAEHRSNAPSVQLQLAEADMCRLDFAGAARHAERALDADPRNSRALMILSNVGEEGDGNGKALERYERAFPGLLGPAAPATNASNYRAALDLARIYQQHGDGARAGVLLDGAARSIQMISRLGRFGHGIADVQIHALRGEKAQALAALREAVRMGWRGPFWRYYRDFDRTLASIRDERGFKDVFADIELDMARQRAELAARPKDAPLALGDAGS